MMSLYFVSICFFFSRVYYFVTTCNSEIKSFVLTVNVMFCFSVRNDKNIMDLVKKVCRILKLKQMLPIPIKLLQSTTLRNEIITKLQPYKLF